MAWRVAKSLITLRTQFNQMYPTRSKKSDGTIGDAKHASRKSDHNPWVRDGSTGIVTALDLTHHPQVGADTWKLAELLRQRRDPRIKYVISNHRIFSSVSSPWQWRRYSGSNPHAMHMHVSVHSQKGHYDSTKEWDIGKPLLPGPAPTNPKEDDPLTRPLLKQGSRGEHVREVQSILGIRADSQFGPATAAAVRKFQQESGLKADGIVGPRTWIALDKIEQRNDGEKPGDALAD